MEILRWPAQKTFALCRSVVTLGIFDGVHLGHRAVIEAVVEEAAARSAPSVIATFDPQPDSVLEGVATPAITSLGHRVRLFNHFGATHCMVINFTPEVARMEAEEFAREVLHGVLDAQLLIFGFDCRFGRGRKGGIVLCERLGPECAWQVCAVPPVEVEGRVVSSTAIRDAVSAGDLPRAGALLGRPYSVLGKVVHGTKRGHLIGVPTANLDLQHELVPPQGVYAGQAVVDSRLMPCVVSVGAQETVHPEGDRPVVVEVHIINAELELYGCELEVQFGQWLRGQRRFESADALAQQIKKDIAAAKTILSENPPGDC